MNAQGLQEQDSGAPTLNPQPDAQAKAVEPEAIVEEAAKAIEGVTVSEEEADKFVTFYAARQYRNARFLAKHGKVITFPVQPGMPPGVTPVGRREGDVWVQFNNSVLVSDDPIIIEWCRAHKQVCRDANDPRTAGWAALKEMQVNLANREIMLPGDVNVDDMLFPEGLEGAVAATPLTEAQGGSQATEAVAQALTAGQKAAQIAAEREADPSRLTP